ncbi:FHA domain-containing protein [uncultured Microscilla sp.]|uniref:FHA domain-containing protein n=1 Tax=uncultured Microscilla sp. TaxID=432653 RepID=UPI0026311098|nr:FHA domain-containing protein [uncultured Microscilla sp.]
MLRCNTCGYINDEHAKNCAKCGAALNDAKKTINNSSAQGFLPTTGSDPLAYQKPSQKTVKGGEPDQPYLDNPKNEQKQQAQQEDQANGCSNCRYPLRAHQNICPNCGFDNAATNATDLHSTKGFDETDEENAPVEPRHKTILDPWEVTNIGDSKKFSLVTDKGKTTLNFEGEEVALNRQNLDVNNKSISGEQHAKIEYENGQWYIKDQSSNGFTFIQVRDRVPIQPGDMIIMGNKLFVFKEK